MVLWYSVRTPLSSVIGIVLIAATFGAIPEVSAAEFFLITELGNAIKINFLDPPGVLENRIPDDPATASDFRQFLYTQSKVIIDELDGWIIKKPCDSIITKPFDSECYVDGITPYMEMPKEDFTYFLEDARASVGAFTHSEVVDDTIPVWSMKSKDVTGSFAHANSMDMFVTPQKSHTSGLTIGVERNNITGLHEVNVYNTDNENEQIAIIQYSPEVLGLTDNEGRIQIAGRIEEGVTMRLVEPIEPIDPNEKPVIISSYEPEEYVERRPPLVAKKNGSDFFVLTYPSTAYGNVEWIMIIVESKKPGNVARITASSGNALVAIEQPLPAKEFSYVVKMGDSVQATGFCENGVSPSSSESNAKYCHDYSSSSRKIYGGPDGVPQSLFGYNHPSPTMYVDYEPLKITPSSNSLILDHRNDEKIELTSDTPKLIHAYFYARIPMHNFGAVEISDTSLISNDPNVDRLPLDYLDGLYDPLKEHPDRVGEAGYRGGVDAKYMHIPIIPRHNSIALNIGETEIQYNFADLPLEQIIIAEKVWDGNDVIKTVKNVFVDRDAPKPQSVITATSEVTIVKPMIADRDGDARMRIETALVGEGLVQNSMWWSKWDGGEKDQTKDKGQVDEPNHNGSPYDKNPISVKIKVYKNGELVTEPEDKVANVDPIPQFECDSDGNMVYCKVDYDDNKIETSVVKVIDIPNVSNGDFIEFFITAKMEIEVDYEKLKPMWCDPPTDPPTDPPCEKNKLKEEPPNDDYTILFQWTEAKSRIEMVNPFIVTQIR